MLKSKKFILPAVSNKNIFITDQLSFMKRSAVQTRQGYGGKEHHETLFSGHVAISVDGSSP